jgi:hypothetical protein
MKNIKMELGMDDFIANFLICPLTNKKTYVY